MMAARRGASLTSRSWRWTRVGLGLAYLVRMVTWAWDTRGLDAVPSAASVLLLQGPGASDVAAAHALPVVPLGLLLGDQSCCFVEPLPNQCKMFGALAANLSLQLLKALPCQCEAPLVLGAGRWIAAVDIQQRLKLPCGKIRILLDQANRCEVQLFQRRIGRKSASDSSL